MYSRYPLTRTRIIKEEKMAGAQPDLIITAGRVFCADTGLDGPGAVAVSGDRIVAAGPDVTGPAGEILDFPDCLLLPGFVDLHAHPAPVTWRFGLDPDTEILPRGTKTVLSQGDAGALNWPVYREEIIERSGLRVRLAISAAVKGEYENRGCFINLDEVDVDACVAAVEEGGEHIWGIAANLVSQACGDNDPREIMRRTLAAAECTGKPILYGVRREPGDWPLAEQLKLLRPGDVFTYCYQGNAETIVADGRVVDEVWEARERGVLFDVGHGKGTSNVGVGPEAIADGFLPDSISTDVYNNHRGWTPPHDMPRTLSRMIAIGMPEKEALARATIRPAKILGLAGEIGTLASGAGADLVVLRWNPHPAPLAEVSGSVVTGPCLEPVLTLRAGKTIRP